MKSSGGEDDSGQKQLPIDVSQLSGKWEGKSLSKRNDPTYWKESVLKFNVISEEGWGWTQHRLRWGAGGAEVLSGDS